MNLIDIAVKSLILASLVLAAIAAMRKASASTRHLILSLALLGLCALPIVSRILPEWSVPLVKTPAPELVQNTAPNILWLAAPDEAAKHSAAAGGPNHIIPANIPTPQKSSIDFGVVFEIIWAAGVFVLGGRLLARLLILRRIARQRSAPTDPALQSIVDGYCRHFKREAFLLEGLETLPPMTWGHMRPVLLLPKDATEWPQDRLRSVILHELAHIERSDWLISIFAQGVTAAFWFNPFVWFVAKRMDWESEIAADDRVLSMGISGPQYATHLLDLLRQLKNSDQPSLSAMAIVRRGQIDGRIRAILESQRSRKSARGMASMALLLLVAACVALVGTAVPAEERQVDLPKFATRLRQAISRKLPSSAPQQEFLIPRPLGDMGDLQSVTFPSGPQAGERETDQQREWRQVQEEAAKERQQASEERRRELKEAGVERQRALEDARRERARATVERTRAFQEAQKERAHALLEGQKEREQAMRDRLQGARERERAAIERQRESRDRQLAATDRQRASLEVQRKVQEQQKAVLESQRKVLERQQAIRDREQAERDRHQADLKREQSARQIEEGERQRQQHLRDIEQNERDRQQAANERKRALEEGNRERLQAQEEARRAQEEANRERLRAQRETAHELEIGNLERQRELEKANRERAKAQLDGQNELRKNLFEADQERRKAFREAEQERFKASQENARELAKADAERRKAMEQNQKELHRNLRQSEAERKRQFEEARKQASEAAKQAREVARQDRERKKKEEDEHKKPSPQVDETEEQQEQRDGDH